MSELRIGIVGVGAMGADHAERVARRTAGARLVAVSDPDVARFETKDTTQREVVEAITAGKLSTVPGQEDAEVQVQL